MNKIILEITGLEQCEEIFILQNKFKKDFGENIWKTNELYDLIINKKLHGFINSWDENIIAFCIFKKIDDFIELYSIFVHPEYRKEGIGKKIINKCIKYCGNNGLRKIVLDVNVNNLTAISLYKKSGFVFCGKRKGYYQNSNSTDDSFSMSLIISNDTI